MRTKSNPCSTKCNMNRTNLHDYQRRAVDFIINRKRCALFLDMGLGKTATTLTAVSDMIDGFMVKRVLVIAPLRVCNSVWKQEAAQWVHLNHLRVSVCTGTEKQRRDALNVKADIFVINRENVSWLVDACQGKWPFDGIVIDESSSFKNNQSQRFKKLKKVAHLSKLMVLLTGTPAPNGLLDIWPQIYLIDQGAALGKTMTGYKKRFFNPDFFGYNWTPKAGSQDEIENLIQPRILSMTASDYLTLPERIDLVEWVTLPDKIMADYRKFERDLIIKLKDGDTLEAVNVAVLANKLLQWSNGAVYTDDSKDYIEIHEAKLNTLAEIIEENPNENIIVAYNYQSDLERLKNKFPWAVRLNKDTSTIDRWNRGEIKLMLAHPASCGHGINLQAGGSMIVWFGLNWSLELDQQMNARLHRQGQSKPVRVVRIAAFGTIDERVMSVINNKEQTQSQLIIALKEGWKCKCQ